MNAVAKMETAALSTNITLIDKQTLLLALKHLVMILTLLSPVVVDFVLCQAELPAWLLRQRARASSGRWGGAPR